MLGTVVRLWLKNFINLIYPLTCLICKVGLSPLSDKPICAKCWSSIEFNLPPFCRVCGKHLPAKSQQQAFICKDCQNSAYFFHQAHSVCIYDGIIKECVHLFKYRNKLSLAKPLSKLMVDFAHKFLDMQAIELILPVPLHKSKLRRRQFNQARLLAQALACAFMKELKDKLLIKAKPTPAQISLSEQERLKNVQGSFKVNHIQQLKGKNILLVDDVVTTKATVNECARVLLEGGAKRVDVFSLARSA